MLIVGQVKSIKPRKYNPNYSCQYWGPDILNCYPQPMPQTTAKKSPIPQAIALTDDLENMNILYTSEHATHCW